MCAGKGLYNSICEIKISLPIYCTSVTTIKRKNATWQWAGEEGPQNISLCFREKLDDHLTPALQAL